MEYEMMVAGMCFYSAYDYAVALVAVLSVAATGRLLVDFMRRANGGRLKRLSFLIWSVYTAAFLITRVIVVNVHCRFPGPSILFSAWGLSVIVLAYILLIGGSFINKAGSGGGYGE